MNPIDNMENMDGMLDKFAPSSSSSRSTGAGASGILKMIKPIPSEYVKADAPEMNKDKLEDDDSGDGDEEDNLSDKIFDVDDDTSSSISPINPINLDKKKKEDVMGDVMGEINKLVENAVRAKTAEKTAQKTAQMEPDDGQLEQKW